jgi:predicted small lipoprotein YifL
MVRFASVRLKERFVNRYCHRVSFRLALIGALAASLGLAACGRKGPLDPPPSATLAGNKVPDKNVNGEQVLDSRGRPHAPAGENKHIPLDDLLN